MSDSWTSPIAKAVFDELSRHVEKTYARAQAAIERARTPEDAARIVREVREATTPLQAYAASLWADFTLRPPMVIGIDMGRGPSVGAEWRRLADGRLEIRLLTAEDMNAPGTSAPERGDKSQL